MDSIDVDVLVVGSGRTIKAVMFSLSKRLICMAEPPRRLVAAFGFLAII